MDKDFILWAILAGILLIGLYSFFGKPLMHENIIVENVDTDGFLQDDEFSNINELHYPKMPITYFIDVDTGANNDNYEVEQIKKALNMITEATEGLVRFREVAEFNNPNILIYGYPPEESEGRFITEGIASPTEVNGNIITESHVELYPSNVALYGGSTRTESDDTYIYTITEYGLRESYSWSADDCDNLPQTELHEILHSFGFGHNFEDSYNIMFPISHKIQACKTEKIDENIISCLKYIYSNGEIEGDCSNLNMYPWPEEPLINDFKWNNLPINYTISGCNDNQKNNLKKAERVLEDYFEQDLYLYKEHGEGNVKFRCEDSIDNVLLNEETDFWDATVYFPSAQPYYSYDNGGDIKDVEILLFAQNKRCGGIEVHQLLHGLGLRKHYGYWMEFETELCDTNNMVLSKKTKDKFKELYNLGSI